MIRELLTQNQSHLLWKDEQGDTFILLKGCEIFEFSSRLLKILVWRRKMLLPLQKSGLFLTEVETDDGLVSGKVSRQDFPKLIELFGCHKRRPNLKGKYIKSLKERLCHDIKPLRWRLVWQPMISSILLAENEHKGCVRPYNFQVK